MSTIVAGEPTPHLISSKHGSAEAGKSTYGQILKSSIIIGGSQFINIVIGMVRTKAMAVLLGPAGFGLFGLYSSAANLIQTLAGMGINSSGVRQIAAAASTGDGKCIQETVLVLRLVSIILGAFGAAFTILFSRQISELTFANDRQSQSICLLSAAVFLTLVSGSQSALIQGMRRIGDLAKIQVIGALSGTLTSIPLVYLYRERGVIPSLICIATMTILSSWWYSRKIIISSGTGSALSVSFAEVRREVGALLTLGIAFMSSSLITLGVAYGTRVMVMHHLGFEATGLYQSAWTLGGLYVGFILQAMGADFYPSLTSSANDNAVCNRMVNEQAQVGLLLAGPGVIASLTLAPLAIALFYSNKFGGAVGIFRWICLATILQVISWPIGFVIVAKAKRTLFIGCEVAWGIVSISLAWAGIVRYGLVGAGIAYFASYVFHGLMVYIAVNRLSGFRWSKQNRKTGAISLSLVAIVFCGFYLLPLTYSVALGLVATLIHLLYSLRTLHSVLTVEQVPKKIQKLMALIGLSDKRVARVSNFD